MLHVIASPELDELNKSSFDPKRKLLKPNPFLLKDDNLNRIMKVSNELLDKALQK
jgi:hypothetical protein